MSSSGLQVVWESFFFFQAEDGIRDDLVTGVQTCALPISFVTPATALIRVGPTPRPVQAPPEIAFEDVTNGYVPKAISSIVPCAPSNKTERPASSALLMSTDASPINGRRRSPSARYSSAMPAVSRGTPYVARHTASLSAITRSSFSRTRDGFIK